MLEIDVCMISEQCAVAYHFFMSIYEKYKRLDEQFCVFSIVKLEGKPKEIFSSRHTCFSFIYKENNPFYFDRSLRPSYQDLRVISAFSSTNQFPYQRQYFYWKRTDYIEENKQSRKRDLIKQSEQPPA